KIRVKKIGYEKITSGHFEDGGFIIDSKSDLFPKWCHVLSSPCAGTVVSDRSLGFTWFSNSSLKKLSFWNNDRFSVRGEETLLLSRDEVNFFDLIAGSQSVSYLAGSAVYRSEREKMSFEVSVCVHPSLHYKLIRCRIDPHIDASLSLGFRFTPALGENSFSCGNVCFEPERGAVKFSRIPRDPFFSYPGFVLARGKKGAFGGYKLLDDSSALILWNINLRANESSEVFFAFGALTSQKYLDAVSVSVGDGVFDLAGSFCRDTLPSGSPGKGLFPFWLSYQAVFSRFFARSGFCQCGGAFGFRDQLQDCLVFIPEKPRRALRHLLRCACHQFPEGDVLHWWHNVGCGSHPGIRTNISDDYLWFPLVLALYVKKTADRSALDVKAPYLSGVPLRQDERERYEKFGFTAARETLKEHALRAINLFFERGSGAHGLPLMGSGDWNDGMDLVGRNGGESVWLAMFASIVIKVFDDEIGLDPVLKKRSEEALPDLIQAVENCFNGKWFSRAYFADGTPLGDDTSLSSECSVDLIPQCFYVLFQEVIYEGKDPAALERAMKACRNAASVLFDSEKRVLRLFYPAFCDHRPDPGYISAYSAGLRENGGQYTHAAVWFCFAIYYLSRRDGGEEFSKLLEKVLDAIDPQRFFDDPHRMKIYRNEPFVLSGDVYHAPGKIGRGGWSWYTGSAGWLYTFYKICGENKKAPEIASEAESEK
ncbi:MAG: hypothetical protein IJV00_02450, partial [Clostridia bacterium]|nr:hypothetical protein [Clostridia bacterium]